MSKLEKLRESFSGFGIDGILVTNSYNRRYITNFTGTAGVALISENAAIFITDFRYVDQASEQVKDFKIVQHSGPIIEEVAKQAEKMGIKKLGFEQDDLSYATS